MEIVELALAYWRLKRWVDKTEVDKKTSAYSSLRKIERYLNEQGVQLIGYDGQLYDIGLPVSVADEDEYLNCDKAIIEQTIEPTILLGETIVHFGKVLLMKENVTDES
ncbi:hypothetical protein [Butyrivibrio sp. YAB3001]|uniref:hypothetical protein n=1 Tax=Butyrivibrio sp. YAB3001 TaxID=1520812 RepID=UPI0008F62EC8|nr:hypothetical protein [Butyrivibrio sp. YAB3001]SFB81679.1 hypothetical protein SAMN02910398_00724 [Butyrivibrio sp. YAB3001]